MIGMIVPPEVIGPGAAVGSQIGPVCVMRPMSELSDENGEREVTEACGGPVEASEEVLDVPKVAVPDVPKVAVPDVPKAAVPDVPKAAVPDVPKAAVLDVLKVAVPLNHVVFGVRVQETEGAEAVELSQSQ